MSVKIKGTIVADDDKWIYEWFAIDATSPRDVAGAMEKETGEEIVFEINSGGGDISAGNEIYYLIKQCQKKTRCSIVGMAASAATFIACGADIVDAVPGLLYMIHNVSGSQDGNFKAMDQMSAILKKADVSITNIYRLKTGMEERELLKLMNAETWMDAKQALDYGFIDEIIGDNIGVLKPRGLYNGVTNILSEEVKEKIRNTVRDPDVQGKPEHPDILIQQRQLKLLKMKGALR